LTFHGFLFGGNWDSPFSATVAKIPLVGWVGVDVFFVLSGFLITGILLDSRDSPNRFRNFYVRRFLRIFPIYWLVLTLVFFVLPHFKSFDTEDLTILYRNQAWLWFYLVNLGYIVHNHAFATANWLNLGHLWSLAIEEQFYMIWPTLVFFLNRRWLKIACVASIIGSPTLRCTLWLMHMSPGALYFPTPCRLDGLAMGAIVAILLRQNINQATWAATARLSAATGAISILAITIWRSGFMFNDQPIIVFGISAVSLLMAATIALAIEPTSITASVFSNPVLRSAGKYSYAAYLFHVPLGPPLSMSLRDSVLTDAFGELLGQCVFTLGLVAITFAAAFVSWHLYEKKWLKLKQYFDYSPSLVKSSGVHG
jgi:peptidoglycan/LPS O-acetylase OafA/YrhL